MCSVQEGDIENINTSKNTRRQLTTDKTKCMKCADTLAVVIVRGNDPLCKGCFLAYFVHKFRATIGKARVIRQGERVLLAFSGGLCSRAMLHMVCEGLSQSAVKKFRFIPGVVFVDEGATLGLGQEERNSNISRVRTLVEKTGFSFHIARLEDVFEDQHSSVNVERQDHQNSCLCKVPLSERKSVPCLNLSAAEKIKQLFKELTSMTSKEDWLLRLRNEVLCKVARDEGYSKVMLGNCATRVAVQLLSNISQGRGGALLYDISFADDRYADITFVRPMREFMAKEIALYNYFNGNTTVNIATLAAMSGAYSSIDQLTENFVIGLQEEYSFTVNTIFRTGEKLASKEKMDNDNQCTMCGVPINNANRTLNHVTQDVARLEINENILSTKVPCLNEFEGACSNICKVASEVEPKLTLNDIVSTLCYGCQLTLKDINSLNVDNLPPFLKSAAQKVLQRSKMKEQIQEFLIEDE